MGGKISEASGLIIEFLKVPIKRKMPKGLTEDKFMNYKIIKGNTT